MDFKSECWKKCNTENVGMLKRNDNGCMTNISTNQERPIVLLHSKALKYKSKLFYI